MADLLVIAGSLQLCLHGLVLFRPYHPQPMLLLFCSLGVISLVFGLVLRFVRGV